MSPTKRNPAYKMAFIITASRPTPWRCRPIPLCLGNASLVIVAMKGNSSRSRRLHILHVKARKPFCKSDRRFAYPIADAIVKIGRYIATTINPTVTPKNTIIIGSKRAVRFVTAWSTSSS